jgi:hypothetical protein
MGDFEGSIPPLEAFRPVLGPDRISRNEAIEIVGKEMFGDAWVGDAAPREMELLREYKFFEREGKRSKPVPPDLVDEVYQVEMRAARARDQIGDAMRWLETRAFDCVRGIKDGFDRQSFNAAFAKAFGRVLPSGTQTKFRNPGDEKLVRDAIVALTSGAATNPLQAAKRVCKRGATGLDDQQAAARLDRIRKAVSKEWRQATAKDRHS